LTGIQHKTNPTQLAVYNKIITDAMARSLLFAALAGVVVAQTTVDILLPIADPQPLEGSIVGYDASLTTYHISCPTGTPSEDCGMPEVGLAITQGSSSWIMNYDLTGDGSYTQIARCKLDRKKDEASCSMYMSGRMEGQTTETSTETVETGLKSLMYPVTITAGASSGPRDNIAAQTTSAISESQTGAAESAAEPTSAAPVDSSSKTTAAAQTSTDDSASNPTETPEGAAGRMSAQSALFLSVAAIASVLLL
jgi:hypothetical protein